VADELLAAPCPKEIDERAASPIDRSHARTRLLGVLGVDRSFDGALERRA
jgi:hypothetical protein